jgi:hypothetical protein
MYNASPDLIAAIETIHQAMPDASDEKIARELRAKFPEVISANRDALLIAGLDSMINSAKGWANGPITIQTKRGPIEVDAEVLGHLAVHDCDGRTHVTHVPTGLQVVSLPPQVSREALRLAVERLQKFDWSFSEPRANFSKNTKAEITSLFQELVDAASYPDSTAWTPGPGPWL